MRGRRASNGTENRSGPHTILLAFGGLALGILILFAERILGSVGIGSGFDQKQTAYVEREQTLLWLLLLGMQIALWMVLLGRIHRTVKGLKAESEGSRGRSQAYVLALLVPVTAGQAVAVWGLDNERPFPGQGLKMMILTMLALGVAAVAAVGVARIYTIAEKTEANADASLLADHVARYLDLRQGLDRLLGAMAAIVAAGVLATGALRNATLSWELTKEHPRPPDEVFPQEQVLVFGLFLSGLLALLAIPAYDRLHTLGERLRERHVEKAVPKKEDWKARETERAEVEKLLRLEGAGLGGFRAGAAILAPLATSIVSNALGGG